MKVLKTRDVPLSDWLSVYKEVRHRPSIPRQPGHETAREIASRLGVSRNTAERTIAELGDRVERGKMTYICANGQVRVINTFRLK